MILKFGVLQGKKYLAIGHGFHLKWRSKSQGNWQKNSLFDLSAKFHSQSGYNLMDLDLMSLKWKSSSPISCILITFFAVDNVVYLVSEFSWTK